MCIIPIEFCVLFFVIKLCYQHLFLFLRRCIALGSWFSIIHFFSSFFFSYIAWKRADFSLISLPDSIFWRPHERKKKSVFRTKGGHEFHDSVYLVLANICSKKKCSRNYNINQRLPLLYLTLMYFSLNNSREDICPIVKLIVVVWIMVWNRFWVPETLPLFMGGIINKGCSNHWLSIILVVLHG